VNDIHAQKDNDDRPTIAAIVLAKNEQTNIARCVQSLHWADEIVVIDDASTDDTVSIATEYGARVVDHRFESFAEQRNWALRHAGLRSQWVVMLDADEVSTDAFANELKARVREASKEVVGFRTCRKTMLDGVWLRYSDGFPVWIMRVVRRGDAWFEDSGHGEVPVPKVRGTLGTIGSPFLHFAFSRGMDDWWARHVRYAAREAQRECELLQEASVWALFSSDPSNRRRALRSLARRMPARGALRFVYQYVFRAGFLDGRQGFHFCRMMACYESMIAIRKWDRHRRKSKQLIGTQ